MTNLLTPMGHQAPLLSGCTSPVGATSYDHLMDGNTKAPAQSYRTEAIIAGSALALATGIAVVATRGAKAHGRVPRQKGLSGLRDSGLVTPKDATDIIAHFHVMDSTLVLVLTQYFPYVERSRMYMAVGDKLISTQRRLQEFEVGEREEFERDFNALLRKKFNNMLLYVRFSGDIRTITDAQVTRIMTDELARIKRAKAKQRRKPRIPKR